MTQQPGLWALDRRTSDARLRRPAPVEHNPSDCRGIAATHYGRCRHCSPLGCANRNGVERAALPKRRISAQSGSRRDDRWVVTVTRSSAVRVWNTSAGTALWPVFQSPAIDRAAVSPDGRYVAVDRRLVRDAPTLDASRGARVGSSTSFYTQRQHRRRPSRWQCDDVAALRVQLRRQFPGAGDSGALRLLDGRRAARGRNRGQLSCGAQLLVQSQTNASLPRFVAMELTCPK